MGILDRFTSAQAENPNIHEDFPWLTRLALPAQHGAVRIPGIRVQDPRMMRLLETRLHAATVVGGWNARQIHAAVLSQFRMAPERYGLNSLRYDLRKLKGHGLLERDKGATPTAGRKKASVWLFSCCCSTAGCAAHWLEVTSIIDQTQNTGPRSVSWKQHTTARTEPSMRSLQSSKLPKIFEWF